MVCFGYHAVAQWNQRQENVERVFATMQNLLSIVDDFKAVPRWHVVFVGDEIDPQWYSHSPDTIPSGQRIDGSWIIVLRVNTLEEELEVARIIVVDLYSGL